MQQRIPAVSIGKAFSHSWGLRSPAPGWGVFPLCIPVQASPRPLTVVLASQEMQFAKLGLRDAWNNIERGQLALHHNGERESSLQVMTNHI
jgi:hypothetical protein